LKIIVDQQEKKALTFEVKGLVSEIIVEHLPFGDYWCRKEDGQEMPVCFERKSISDLWGSFASKTRHRRFRDNIEKARKHDFTFILVIEGTLSEVYQGYPRSNFKGVSMVKLIFTLWVRYNLHPVFCSSREEMAKFIVETFEAKGREDMRGKK